MSIEYESVVVKSRVLVELFMLQATLSMVIKYVITLPYANSYHDGFNEYGFSERPLYVIKLRR